MTCHQGNFKTAFIYEMHIANAWPFKIDVLDEKSKKFLKFFGRFFYICMRNRIYFIYADRLYFYIAVNL